MTKKITISVSEDLHRQLKNYRDSINISKICAEALKMKIEKIDLTLHEAKKRFNLLELSEYTNLAYEDGQNWAGYRATPIELAIVSNWTYGWVSNDKQCQKTIELLEENNKEIKKIMSGYSVGYEYILSSSFINKGIVNFFIDYGDGDVQIAVAFAQGAQIIWNKIKNQLLPKLIDPEYQF